MINAKDVEFVIITDATQEIHPAFVEDAKKKDNSGNPLFCAWFSPEVLPEESGQQVFSIQLKSVKIHRNGGSNTTVCTINKDKSKGSPRYHYGADMPCKNLGDEQYTSITVQLCNCASKRGFKFENGKMIGQVQLHDGTIRNYDGTNTPTMIKNTINDSTFGIDAGAGVTEKKLYARSFLYNYNNVYYYQNRIWVAQQGVLAVWRFAICYPAKKVSNSRYGMDIFSNKGNLYSKAEGNVAITNTFDIYDPRSGDVEKLLVTAGGLVAGGVAIVTVGWEGAIGVIAAELVKKLADILVEECVNEWAKRARQNGNNGQNYSCDESVRNYISCQLRRNKYSTGSVFDLLQTTTMLGNDSLTFNAEQSHDSKPIGDYCTCMCGPVIVGDVIELRANVGSESQLKQIILFPSFHQNASGQISLSGIDGLKVALEQQ